MEVNRRISKEQQEIYIKNEKKSKNNFMIYKEYLKKIIYKNELKIIDLGGGSGCFANDVKLFFDRKNIKTDITVIDYCEYIEWKNFKNINFVKRSIFDELDHIKNESIDIIFINDVLHHLVYDSYKKSRIAQRKLFRLVFAKLKKGGYFFIGERCCQNPIIKDFSSPIIYYLTSSKRKLIRRMSKKIGANSAGVGVCFLSSKLWCKIANQSGFIIIDKISTPWYWKKKFFIQAKEIKFILKK